MPADLENSGLAQLRRSYIDLELQLGEIDRVRTLYQKYLQWAPAQLRGLVQVRGGGAQAWASSAARAPSSSSPSSSPSWTCQRSSGRRAAALCLHDLQCLPSTRRSVQIAPVMLLHDTMVRLALWVLSQPCSPHGLRAVLQIHT